MEVDDLKLPSNPELWVKMRRKILWGDETAVESAVLRCPPGEEIAVFKRQRVYQLIEGWSLHRQADGTVGIEGVPLPMHPDSLKSLEPVDGHFLYKYAEHRFDNREDVANPFVPGSQPSAPESESGQSSETKSSSSPRSPRTRSAR
jgi:hypothetical protein